MFHPEGPSLRELTVQALSSVEHGYDLLAPKFDRTPFRTPEPLLGAMAAALTRPGVRPGGYAHGLDLCCGTGAGVEVLAEVCRETATGVDFSTGMLEVARARAWPAAPRVSWVRADARALPFAPAFDLVVSLGAFGHFLPRELPALLAQVRAVLRPGGDFVFPVLAPPRPTTRAYWMLAGFDAVMRVRNALWRPPFVMYYRAFGPGAMERELTAAGFRVGLTTLPEFGRRDDGSPRVRMVTARVE
ncbi:class I SAM-dependent methyltransferase [Streptomyces sp. NPDC004610]|uniref:class I SAM-dependent methyltransferase n=1 Tax=unclassified Streptomyces TaxID=2593676 RepID=UPI0033ACA7E0